MTRHTALGNEYLTAKRNRKAGRVHAHTPSVGLSRAVNGTVVHVWYDYTPMCNRRGIKRGDGESVAVNDRMCVKCAQLLDELKEAK
jgi:NAD-dependent dihydropyrimidine dehydrogenase PreA subunit